MRLVQRSFLTVRAGFGLAALAFACAALLLGAGGARAAFDSRGVEVLDLPGPTASAAYGKRTLIAVGYGPDQGIMRLRANGSIDGGFGENGRAKLSVTDLAVTADGRILVLGRSAIGTPNYEPTVTRLLPDGSVDRSFGGGTIRVDLGGKYDFAARIALDSQGRILVAGTSADIPAQRGFSPGTLAITRLRPGGAVDRGFGRNGSVAFGEGSGEESLSGLTAGPRDSVFVVSGAREVFKLRPGGSPDPGFGKEGRANLWELRNQAGIEFLSDIETVGVTRGGKVLIAGSDPDGDGKELHYRAAALRLMPDGSLDTGYGQGGLATARIGAWFFASSMLLQRSGRLVVAGSSQQPAGHNSAFAAVAFDTRGRIDRTFGHGGKLRIDLGATWTLNNAIVPRPGGQALLIGSTSEEGGHPGGPRGLALARIDLYNGKRR